MKRLIREQCFNCKKLFKNPEQDGEYLNFNDGEDSKFYCNHCMDDGKKGGSLK